jgi:hypothetical protein
MKNDFPERIWTWTTDDCSSDNEDEWRLEIPYWTEDPPNWTIGTEYIRKDVVQDLIDTIRRGQNEERFASLLLQKTAWK